MKSAEEMRNKTTHEEEFEKDYVPLIEVIEELIKEKANFEKFENLVEYDIPDLEKHQNDRIDDIEECSFLYTKKREVNETVKILRNHGYELTRHDTDKEFVKEVLEIRW